MEEKYISKVVLGDQTLIDISGDTVTPETLADGATAHNSAGEKITGTMKTISEVDASKVIFDETVYTGYAVGNITLSGGKGVLINKGDNLLEAMKAIWTKTVYPTKSNPYVTITLNNAGSYEIGTWLSRDYSVSFTKGYYSLGGKVDYDTEVEVTQIKLTNSHGHIHRYYIGDNGNWWLETTISTSVTTKDTKKASTTTTLTGNFANATVQSTDYKITAEITYSDGKVPLDSDNQPYPEGQITADTKSAVSSSIKGYRNSFYGTLPHKNPLTPTIIRDELTMSNKALAEKDTFEFPIPDGAVRVVIAYPYTLSNVDSIIDVQGQQTDIKGSFNLVKDVDENGNPKNFVIPSASNGSGAEYKVYVMDYGEPYENTDPNAPNTYKVTI